MYISLYEIMFPSDRRIGNMSKFLDRGRELRTRKASAHVTFLNDTYGGRNDVAGREQVQRASDTRSARRSGGLVDNIA